MCNCSVAATPPVNRKLHQPPKLIEQISLWADSSPSIGLSGSTKHAFSSTGRLSCTHPHGVFKESGSCSGLLGICAAVILVLSSTRPYDDRDQSASASAVKPLQVCHRDPVISISCGPCFDEVLLKMEVSSNSAASW